MEENQISLSSLFMAYVRGYHAMHDCPKIFDDYLGYHLMTNETRAIIEQKFRPTIQFIESIDPASAASCDDPVKSLAWGMQNIPSTSPSLSRSRYTEDSLEEAVRQGVRQYVILGAGMDTFAFRRSEMLAKLEVFEVDHPATQEYKRQRITELGWKEPEQLHYISIDFTQETLKTALMRSSYDPKTLSFFSWLGVTYFLPVEAVFATLREFCNNSLAGSMLIFDYMTTDIFIPGRVDKCMQLSMDKVRQVGEPLISGFNPSTLAKDLAPLGLRVYENLSPTDIEERYFQGRTDNYHANQYVHFACVVVE